MKNKIKLPSNRNFGIFFFIVFLIIGFWPLLNQSDPRYWLIFISLGFLILGILNSKVLTPLNKIWFYFGITLGKIISPVVMGIIFFLVVTPTGIIMRLLGKDILNLKKNTKATYWINKEKINTTMKRQF
tara:strand:+ start:633 stop:1019 length:387 start_codon:yes stop_codon:yes gene_type:complete